MTWSYSGNPNESDKDKVRFLLGDTDKDDQLISDEEILYLLDVHTNEYEASSEGARAIAGMFSRQADRSLGDFSVSLSQKAQAYLELSDRLRREADRFTKPIPFAGGISHSQKRTEELNDDRVNPAFKRGQFDSPFVRGLEQSKLRGKRHY